MSLLGRSWSLLDVDDVERLARRALEDSLRVRNMHLRPHEHDDAVAFLVATAWELSRNFDPARGGRFSSYCYARLRLRFVDFVRGQEGRTRWAFRDHVYERTKPKLLSLDADNGDGGVGETLAAREGDPAARGGPDFIGLLGGGDRQRSRDLDVLGLEPPRRVA